MCRMLLWWSLASFICLSPSSGRSQSTTLNHEAENTLALASSAREDLIFQLSRGNRSNSTCSCTQGIRDMTVNLFQVFNEVVNSKGSDGTACGNLPFAANLSDQLKAVLNEDTNAGVLKKLSKFSPYAIINQLREGTLTVTKPLLVGLLLNSQHNIHSPDFITLLENVAEAVNDDKVKVPNHKVCEGVEEILGDVLSENDFSPSMSFQVMQLISILGENIHLSTLSHPLLLMKPDEFPADVIMARDILLAALANGSLNVHTPNGWENKPEFLLAMLTKLLNTPNHDPHAAYIHVVYSHYRMKYLSGRGYVFEPNDISDIAFLLNSFLTIRSPNLIQAMFLEFSREDLPWQDLITNIDYSQYSSPRTLLLDIIKSIVSHPESLKVCNTILFNFFLNADKNSTPEWLKMIFPNTTHYFQPIDLSKIKPEATETKLCSGEDVTSMCPGQEVTIIDPDCILEIIDTEYHTKLITDYIRYNPALAADYPYSTRETAFKAILEDLQMKKYSDYVSEFVINQALQRMPLNDKRYWKLEFKDVCPDELQKMLEKAPPIQPEVDIFEPTPTTELPETEECTEEEDTYIQDTCKKVKIINQDSLMNITLEKHIRTLKEILFWKPVFYNDYKELNTREEVLKKVLLDRQEELNDEILDLMIPQIIGRLKMNAWASSLPPIVEEICEDDLQYNVTFPDSGESSEESEPELPCTEELTINPHSLIEILPKGTHNDLIERLILSKPLLAEKFKNFTKRGSVLNAALVTRSEELNTYETIYAVKKAVAKMKLNWKAKLPIQYLEKCPSPAIDKIFTGVVEGLGEATVPCEIEDTTEPIPMIPSETTPSNISPFQSLKCSANEEPTNVVDIESLWEALSDTAPKAPLIRAKMKSYIVVFEKGVNYTKSFILRQVLERMKQETTNPQMQHNIQVMINCIRQDEPGLQLAGSVMMCLPRNSSEVTDSKEPNCTPDEVLTTVVNIESLYNAFSPTAPKAHFIKSKMNSYIIPVDEDTIYTKAEVLTELLRNMKADTNDTHLLRNIDILLKYYIMNDGPGLEEPEIEEVCVPDSDLIEGTTQTIFTTPGIKTTLSPVTMPIETTISSETTVTIETTISPKATATIEITDTSEPFPTTTTEETIPSETTPKIDTISPETPTIETTGTPESFPTTKEVTIPSETVTPTRTTDVKIPPERTLPTRTETTIYSPIPTTASETPISSEASMPSIMLNPAIQPVFAEKAPSLAQVMVFAGDKIPSFPKYFPNPWAAFITTTQKPPTFVLSENGFSWDSLPTKLGINPLRDEPTILGPVVSSTHAPETTSKYHTTSQLRIHMTTPANNWYSSTQREPALPKSGSAAAVNSFDSYDPSTVSNPPAMMASESFDHTTPKAQNHLNYPWESNYNSKPAITSPQPWHQATLKSSIPTTYKPLTPNIPKSSKPLERHFTTSKPSAPDSSTPLRVTKLISPPIISSTPKTTTEESCEIDDPTTSLPNHSKELDEPTPFKEVKTSPAAEQQPGLINSLPALQYSSTPSFTNAESVTTTTEDPECVEEEASTPEPVKPSNDIDSESSDSSAAFQGYSGQLEEEFPDNGDEAEDYPFELPTTTTTVTTTTTPKPCHQAENIIDTESLLLPVTQEAIRNAKDIVQIIQKSSILAESFEGQTSCQITKSILEKMLIAARSKLKIQEQIKGATKEVKLWLMQIQLLLDSLTCHGLAGQLPNVIAKCINHKIRE